jgi:DNA adenine methylase
MMTAATAHQASQGKFGPFLLVRHRTVAPSNHLLHARKLCTRDQEIIRRFDRPTTLFYLDPPYFRRRLYNFNFSDDDFRILAELLRNIRGKVVLSINDTPEIRSLFPDFKLREIELHYTAQRQAGKRFPELIITNF